MASTKQKTNYQNQTTIQVAGGDTTRQHQQPRNTNAHEREACSEQEGGVPRPPFTSIAFGQDVIG